MVDFVFDTETTGLVNHKVPDHTIQPHPVQIACILVDGSKIMNMVSIIVNPLVPVTEGAAQAHGITQEVIERHGLSMKAATGIFLNFLNKADRIVGHNIDFDIIVAEAMLYRTLTDYDMSKFREVPRVCTMHSTTDVCRIPSKNKWSKYKWPTLDEAYRTLVDPKGFSGAHDALNDVMACWKVLQALEEQEYILQRGKR